MEYKRIEEAKEPLIYGDIYLVPCIVKEVDGMKTVTPVINHPHSDIENGQNYVHYHTDHRFLDISKLSGGHQFRPLKGDGELVYMPLPVIFERDSMATSTRFIMNSELKNKCMVNNRCPHKGYDLSNTEAVKGVITCPLHGVRILKKTKKVIPFKGIK